MKKYYRLILVLVSILSFTAVLIYRAEYNRLRYVLEVLNFFGKPGELAVSSDCLINGSIFTAENISFTESVPVWHRLNNDLYMYSAFWEDIGKIERVKAIGVGRDPSSLKVGCRLWYENQEFSVEGRVSHSVIPMRIKQSSLDKEKVFPYFFTCSPEVTLDTVPFAVEFYLDGYQASEVVLSVDSSDYSQDITNSTVICIAPSNRKISPSETAEFIAYHQVLGISHFLVYDTGLLTPSTTLLLKEKSLGFRVTIVPWNFPFTAAEASTTALHSDCLLRSAILKPAGVLQLSWHQLAVPQYHHTLTALVHDFDTHAATARFLLPNLRFCLEYPEQKSDLPLRALKRPYYADTKPFEEQEIALERPHLVLQGSRTQQRVSRGIIGIRSYELCVDVTSTQPVPQRKYDNSMSRFLPDLQASKLLKLWRHHRQSP
ncbi:hypothetical protein B566_EDAN000799 [Ephemera danica]|nr:hypothetical protein B566_EDAN000799 [Ephemera danica]